MFNRDSSQLFTASLDGTLRRWDLATGKDTVLLAGPTPIRWFALSRDGRVAVLVGEGATKLIQADGTVQDLGQGAPWCVMYAEFEPVRDRLLMRRCDYSLVMLDHDRLIELPTSNLPVRKIAVSPDGSRIATTLGDRSVRLHDAETGRVLRTQRGHTDQGVDVAV